MRQLWFRNALRCGKYGVFVGMSLAKVFGTLDLKKDIGKYHSMPGSDSFAQSTHPFVSDAIDPWKHPRYIIVGPIYKNDTFLSIQDHAVSQNISQRFLKRL